MHVNSSSCPLKLSKLHVFLQCLFGLLVAFLHLHKGTFLNVEEHLPVPGPFIPSSYAFPHYALTLEPTDVTLSEGLLFVPLFPTPTTQARAFSVVGPAV